MTPSGFCELVEGRLGWQPPPSRSPYQRYYAEARKVRHKIAQDPARYTWRNLRLAVELLRRRQETRTPVGVFAYVDQAVSMANDPTLQLETRMRTAIAKESALGDPQGWAAQLMRARGPFRAQVLAEWEAERG